MVSTEYDLRQTTKWYRKQNNVKSHRILDVNDGEITIRLPKIYNGKTATFKLVEKLIPQKHIVGAYVDLIIEFTIYDGVPGGYGLTYVGLTPPDFIPADGKEIGN